MSPRPRSRHKDDQILDTAIEMFAEHGVDAIGVAEVARRAGVGLGTLYLRFPSKEALAEAAYLRAKRAWASAVLDDWPIEASPVEQFRTYWDRLARFAREQRSSALYIERHPAGHAAGPESAALRAELDRRVTRIVAAWTTGEAGISPLPIEVVGAMVHGTFWHLAETPAPSGRHDELLAAARDAVWRALRA